MDENLSQAENVSPNPPNSFVEKFKNFGSSLKSSSWFFLTLVLLMGVGVTTYLALHQAIFNQNADFNQSGSGIKFIDSNGSPIYQTTTTSVKLQITYIPTQQPLAQTPCTSDVQTSIDDHFGIALGRFASAENADETKDISNITDIWSQCLDAIGSRWFALAGDGIYPVQKTLINSTLYHRWIHFSDANSAEAQYLAVSSANCGNGTSDNPKACPLDPQKIANRVNSYLNALHTGGLYWRIGNEVNLNGPGEISPQLFATQFHTIVPIIKSLDPGAKIIGPSLSLWDNCDYYDDQDCSNVPLGRQHWLKGSDWFSQFLQSYQSQYGTLPPLDVLDIHLYDDRIQDDAKDSQGKILWEGTNVQYLGGQLQSYRQWLDSHGFQNQPIWITEFGIADCGQIVDQQNNCASINDPNLHNAVLNFIQGMVTFFHTNQDQLKLQHWFLFANMPISTELQWITKLNPNPFIPIRAFTYDSDNPNGYSITGVSDYGRLYGQLSARYGSPVNSLNQPTASQPVFPQSLRIANSISDLANAAEYNASLLQTIDWTLPDRSGEKTVYAQFKVAGVWQPPFSATISLDGSLTSTPNPSPTVVSTPTLSPPVQSTTVSQPTISSQAQQRDAIRKADVQLIRTTLDNYFANHKAYPSQGGQSCGSSGSDNCPTIAPSDTSNWTTIVGGSSNYSGGKAPVDPLNIYTNGWNFTYIMLADGTICAWRLEINTGSGGGNGDYCLKPNNH